MRCVLALAVAAFATSALAAPAPPQASKSEIIASTKRLVANDCRPHDFGGGLHVTGCALSPAFINSQWSVIVRYVLADKKGNPAPAMGAFSLYIFDRSGKFIKIIPGM
jgi:hypothetical protein